MSRLRVWIMPTYIGPQTNRIFLKYVDPFLRLHPGLSLEMRLVPWGNAYSELTQAFKSGDPPDLFQTGTTWVGALANLGFIAPAPTGIDDRPALAPWINEMALVQGDKFALPWLTECTCLQVRSDILDSIGFSTDDIADWNGFLQACLRISLHSKGARIPDSSRPLPFALTCRPDNNMLHNITPWLWAGGWQIPDFNNHPIRVLSDPSAQPAWEFLSQLWRETPLGNNMGILEPHLIENNFYQEGRFAFFNSYWWRILQRATGRLADSEFPWPFQVIPFPKGPAGAFPRGGGSVLAVSRKSKYPKLAWELAHFLINDSFIDEWVKISGFAPAHEGSFWSKYAGSPDVAFILNQIKTARTYPSHPLWKVVEKFLFTGLNDVLWRFLQGNPYDEIAQHILTSTDEQINSVLELADLS